MTDQLTVLHERRMYLDHRIEAKKQVGWETQWDERERDALAWAIERLSDGLESVVVPMPEHIVELAKLAVKVRGKAKVHEVIKQAGGRFGLRTVSPDRFEFLIQSFSDLLK